MFLYYIAQLFLYIKLNFKLKIDTKICTIKNLEEIWKKHLATLEKYFVVIFI